MTFNLTQEQYESLVALARRGAAVVGAESVHQLEDWLKHIETHNGIKRNFVLVQWQELEARLPPGTFFPTTWPPELRGSIEFLTRSVSRADVDNLLQARAKKPVAVLCTKDPAGVLGWTPIDDFFSEAV